MRKFAIYVFSIILLSTLIAKASSTVVKPSKTPADSSDRGYFRNMNMNLLLKQELSNKLVLISGVGYDNLIQKVYLLEDPNNPTNEELNSHYKLYWRGVHIGLDLNYSIGKFSVSGVIRGGYYNYYAKANWNLIPNFKKPISFEQKANGYKYQGRLSLSNFLSKNLELNSGGNFYMEPPLQEKTKHFYRQQLCNN